MSKPQPTDTITSMIFAKPLVVRGRSIDDLGRDYEAKLLEFPWVGVWPKGEPEQMKVTTLFNVTCRNAFPGELAAVMPPAPPAPKGKPAEKDPNRV